MCVHQVFTRSNNSLMPSVVSKLKQNSLSCMGGESDSNVRSEANSVLPSNCAQNVSKSSGPSAAELRVMSRSSLSSLLPAGTDPDPDPLIPLVLEGVWASAGPSLSTPTLPEQGVVVRWSSLSGHTKTSIGPLELFR